MSDYKIEAPVERRIFLWIVGKIALAMELAYRGLSLAEKVTLRKAVVGFLVAFAGAVGLGSYLVIVGLGSAGAALPGTSQTNVVPAFGDQGYDVHTFCEDPLTRVGKDSVNPPDSTFIANYTLDRVKDGVHEVVTVGVYSEPGRMPTGIHYNSVNNPADAFVSREAMDCIRRKA